MKKLLLFIGLSVLTFGAFAEKVPSVIVSKSQGGLTALFNLYNYVHYTPAEMTGSGVAQLDCAGSGFAPCRVPNCTSLTVNDGSTVTNVSQTSKVNAFVSAINDVIGQYEAALEQAYAENTSTKPQNGKIVSVPSVYTKTIAMANSHGLSANQPETYVVRGVVTANTTNSSTMKIYIEKVNILSSTGSL